MGELAADRIVDVFNCTRSASISGAARVFDFCGKQAADAALLECCNRNMNRSELVLPILNTHYRKSNGLYVRIHG